MDKEQELYIKVWDNVSDDVKELPKESVRHITEVVKLMIEKEKQSTTDEQPLIQISSPSGNHPYRLTQEDVWGKWSKDHTQKLSKGMVVAKTGDTCPHFEDVIPRKSVTVVCKKDQMDDVIYWLEYVHGVDSVEGIKDIFEGRKVAIRSQYQLD